MLKPIWWWYKCSIIPPKHLDAVENVVITTGIKWVVAALNSLKTPSLTHTFIVSSIFLGWLLFNAT